MNENEVAAVLAKVAWKKKGEGKKERTRRGMKPNGEEPKEVGGSSLTPLTDIEYNNLLSFHFLSISPEFVQI